MFSFSFPLFCSTWNIFWKRFLLKAFTVNFFICEIFNEWKFFIADRLLTIFYATGSKSYLESVFIFCEFFHIESAFIVNFFTNVTDNFIIFKWKKFSSQISEPVAQEFTFFFHLWIFSHWKRFHQYVSVFICENFHNCDFVKKITMKAFAIVKYFTKFLSIFKLFRNVSGYSLVFVRYCEGFHKVPRKLLQTYKYGLDASCKRFQVSNG